MSMTRHAFDRFVADSADGLLRTVMRDRLRRREVVHKFSSDS